MESPLLDKNNLTEPDFEQHVLEYVARISKDLMVLAQAEGLEFLAYFLGMAHQESIDMLDKSKSSEQKLVRKI